MFSFGRQTLYAIDLLPVPCFPPPPRSSLSSCWKIPVSFKYNKGQILFSFGFMTLDASITVPVHSAVARGGAGGARAPPQFFLPKK